MAYISFKSAIVPIAQVINLPISSAYTHCFAGIRFFDDQGVQIVPTLGTVTVEAQRLTNRQFSQVVGSPIDAAVLDEEAEWSANTTNVRATAIDVQGNNVTSYQLVVVQNET